MFPRKNVFKLLKRNVRLNTKLLRNTLTKRNVLKLLKKSAKNMLKYRCQ